ncbi:MAG TPA: hypothetical protein VH025_08755 [Solirubrobacteraceae bacterium]|jgi:hypothetical protein|nr:hypothetical protein [Solirubrobacteraceae bacterium]
MRFSRRYAAAPLAVIVLSAGAALACAPDALAAARPSLALVGVPTGLIGGTHTPYAETNSSVELDVGYSGRLSGGAKLVLLEKTNSVTPFKATRAKIKLAGGRAKLHVAQGGIGGPYKYEIAVVSGARRLATSKAASIYWTRPPGGIFVSDGDESAYTSLTVASENCEPIGKCTGDAASGESIFLHAYSGTAPIPPGWRITLLLDGSQMCTTTSIEGACQAPYAFPQVSSATPVQVTAEAISPTGTVRSATIVFTDFP